MKGFGAGFLEVAAAFKLGLKNRKAFMINDWSGGRSTLPAEGNQEQRLEVGKSTGPVCGSVKTWFFMRVGFEVGSTERR